MSRLANGRLPQCRGTVERGDPCRRPVYLSGLCYWCWMDGPEGRRAMLRAERERAANGAS